MEYFLAFLPIDYIKEEMLPATNKFAKENGHRKLFTYEEFIHVLGILYIMKVVELLEHRMYWQTKTEQFFPGLCFSFGSLSSTSLLHGSNQLGAQC